MLFSRGIFVRNQSVLIRGVNDTVATMHLLIKRLGRLPKRGESITVDGLRFVIRRADSRRLHVLQVQPQSSSQLSPQPGQA